MIFGDSERRKRKHARSSIFQQHRSLLVHTFARNTGPRGTASSRRTFSASPVSLLPSPGRIPTLLAMVLALVRATASLARSIAFPRTSLSALPSVLVARPWSLLARVVRPALLLGIMVQRNWCVLGSSMAISSPSSSSSSLHAALAPRAVRQREHLLASHDWRLRAARSPRSTTMALGFAAAAAADDDDDDDGDRPGAPPAAPRGPERAQLAMILSRAAPNRAASSRRAIMSRHSPSSVLSVANGSRRPASSPQADWYAWQRPLQAESALMQAYPSASSTGMASVPRSPVTRRRGARRRDSGFRRGRAVRQRGAGGGWEVQAEGDELWPGHGRRGVGGPGAAAAADGLVPVLGASAAVGRGRRGLLAAPRIPPGPTASRRGRSARRVDGGQ